MIGGWNQETCLMALSCCVQCLYSVDCAWFYTGIGHPFQPDKLLNKAHFPLAYSKENDEFIYQWQQEERTQYSEPQIGCELTSVKVLLQIGLFECSHESSLLNRKCQVY